MSLVHWRDQVDDGVVALECHRCHTRYAGAGLSDILVCEELRCSACGTGGLIPHRTSSLAERFPAPLDRNYTPIPNALTRHRDALGLGSNDLLVILALEQHRWAAGDEVFPSRSTIAELTGLSVRSVDRTLHGLVEAKLITKRPRYNSNAGQASNSYDLAPLWVAVAALEPQRHTDTPPGVREAPPLVGGPADCHADAPSPRQNEHWGGVTLAHEKEEVDLNEVLPEVDPVGTGPAPPATAAHITPVQEPETDPNWIAFTTERENGAYPGASVMKAWELFQARKAEHIEEAAA